MVNSTQNGSPSSGSLIPCAQRSLANKQNSPASTQQGTPTHSQSTSHSQQYPISKIPLVSSSLHSHMLILRMLHHCNLLHQHPSHFNSLLLHTSNTSHSYSHQCQSCMLHTSSRVSHTLYNPGLAPKANLSGNQDNHHYSDNILTLLHSLSFELQRHNKIQCPTHRSLESSSKWAGSEEQFNNGQDLL